MRLDSLPTILSIDTATDVCSVALLRAGRIEERSETVGHRHSERVLPMALALLADAGLDLAACDALAFGAGPGAFTGLRIACGVVQGLAYGAGKPAIPVGNLEALALAVLRQYPQAECVLCANDARMREAYVAVYRRSDGAAVERLAPALVGARDLGDLIEHWAPDVVAGDAPTTFAQELASAAASRRLVSMRATAASVADCAAYKWSAGQAVEPARAAPLYVRDHVALTIEERRRRQGSPA
ncbi:MAG: tRNA (adenosine(37)-N6)-threonylcarbamoyltransferase complex dimerization subunit type 1 TsaB [Gemmatimonadota bacterium]